MIKLFVGILTLAAASALNSKQVPEVKPLPKPQPKVSLKVIDTAYFDCSGYTNAEPEFLLRVKRSKDTQYVLVDFCGAANDDLYGRPQADQEIKKLPK